MKIAQIINNTIHKIYKPEEAEWYRHAALDLRTVPDEAQEGWVWDGEQWVEPIIEPLIAMPSAEQIQAASLRMMTLSTLADHPEAVEAVTAAIAPTVSLLADPWAAGTEYMLGQVVSIEERYYLTVKAHTSQAHQPPGGPEMYAIYRPIYPPGTLPDRLEWLKGEPGLKIGDRRWYEGVEYEAINLPGDNLWPPPSAASIWKAIVE